MTRSASLSTFFGAGGAATTVLAANVSITATYLRSFNNPNPWANNAYDYFAEQVNTNGTYIIVSAYGEAENAFNDNSGKVYVFSIANGALAYTLRNPSQAGASYFGQPLAVSGNTIAVSASYDASYAGKAYVYNMSSWTQTTPATITTASVTLYDPNPIGTSSFDLFGKSIDVLNNLMIVGSQESGNVAGDYAGRAYVYDTSGNLWYTLRNPNAYGSANNDAFGDQVAISNSYFAVSATAELDSGATSQSGKVYLFDINGNHNYTLNNPNIRGTSNNDMFGNRLAMSNTYLLVAASGEDTATTTNFGAVYVYDLTALPAYSGTPITVTSPTYTLLNPLSTPDNYDYFGSTIDIDGTRIAIGAAGAGQETGSGYYGKVFLYDTRNLALADANTTLLPTTTISVQGANTGFGKSVAVFGNTLAVGMSYGNGVNYASVYTLS